MTLGRAVMAIALISGACSAEISNGGNASLDGADAGLGPGVDGKPGATCARRTVYLNFEGQALTKGTSDATTNHAEWMEQDTGTAPPYHAGVAGRATEIQQIVDGVRAQLSAFPITVVTARPASGEYVMIVLGGRANQVRSAYGSAVNRLDCDDSRHNDVAWVSDGVAPLQHVVNTVIGAIGFGLGLTATTDPKDCMCGWANTCDSDDTVACTLGTSIARDPDADQQCAGAAATQDEVAALRGAFCGA